MIQHVWSVLCQSAAIDTQTNNVSLFNAFEKLQVFGVPSEERPFILSCEIVSLWTREDLDKPCSGQVRVSFFVSTEKVPQTILLDIDLTRTPFHRTRITISSLAMITTGRFEFLVDYHLAGQETWQPAARLPFIVSSQTPEESIS
jgi:hypothetical protein